MPLQLKLDEETKAPIVDEEGKILYIDDEDQKEVYLNPPELYGKVIQLGQENKKHRDKHQLLVELYKPFEGIDNIEEWKTKADEALEKVANFNDKDLVKAEKVEALKKEISEAWEKKLLAKDVSIADMQKAHNEAIDKLNGQIRTLLVSNKFSNSKFFSGENPVTILPASIAEDHFGKHFQVEVNDDGVPEIKAYYNGDEILSRANPGKYADFEEAIEIIIDRYPDKDRIIRSTKKGSGAGGGEGDGDKGKDDLAALQQQLNDAQKNGNYTLAVSLTNKISKIKRDAISSKAA